MGSYIKRLKPNNYPYRLADFCLEDYQGEVISHYLDFTHEDKKMAFVDYWGIIKK